MNLFKRFIYYLIGVSLGSIIVYFIWKGKEVSFDYGMDARTLKSIRTKKLHYSENARSSMKEMAIDSTAIISILKNGDIDFGKSNQHKKSCPEYFVTGKHFEKEFQLWIIRCDSMAKIEKIIVRE